MHQGSTVILLLLKAIFMPSIQPKLGEPRNSPRLAPPSTPLILAIRYSSILSSCPNHLNTLWSALLANSLSIPAFYTLIQTLNIRDTPTKLSFPSLSLSLSFSQHFSNPMPLLRTTQLAPLLTLTTQHATATHPASSLSHYHTPPSTHYLTNSQITVPLYPNPPPLHAIPYTTSSSSTPTQSLHRPLTPALAPQTHYPSFSRIVIPPQSHTPQLNTQDGYQRTTQRGTTANDHNIFYGKWCTMYNNNWTTWWRWWVQLQLPGANQLILNNK